MKISRRDFLRMAAYTAAAVGVSDLDLIKLNEALAGTGPGTSGRPQVIWFEGLGDQGCVVSAANYFDGVSGIEGVLLNNIELRYNSVLMGAAGQLAIDQANNVLANYTTKPYILILTGAISNLNGYCIVGQDGSAQLELVEYFSKLEQRANWVILAGSCAAYGGVNMIGGNQNNNDPEAILPNHTGGTAFGGYAVTRNQLYRPARSIYIPGCPVHPDWLILTIVHLLTKGVAPPLDSYRRPTSVTIGTTVIPLFQNTVHSQCPRLAKHDAGQFAVSVGDPVNCLESVGCRGKETFADCPTRGWNSTGTNKTGKWCNAPGINHLCIGCTQPMFPAVPMNRQINNITFP
jgi:hydrogenase small subunit